MSPKIRRWIIIILMWVCFGFLAFQAYKRGSTGLPFYIGVGMIAVALFWLTRAIMRVSGKKR